MALPKSHRLSLRFDRERLNQTGKTVFGKFFTLVVAETPEDKKAQSPRLAILLSKKTASLAVDRNKIKRVTSAIIENTLSSIPPKDYLIVPKRQVHETDFQILKKDLSNLLKSS